MRRFFGLLAGILLLVSCTESNDPSILTTPESESLPVSTASAIVDGSSDDPEANPFFFFLPTIAESGPGDTGAPATGLYPSVTICPENSWDPGTETCFDPFAFLSKDPDPYGTVLTEKEAAAKGAWTGIAHLDCLNLNKVVDASTTPRGGQTEELVVFILHRQDIETFRPLVDAVRNIIGEHAQLEVDTVVPVARIPKTTSGKVQRAKLLNAYLDGEFDNALAELEPGPDADVEVVDDDPIVAELLAICRDVSKDRQIGADDNLFEVGVSSLTLTELVLAVDEKYPGKLDISDLFDYPTLRDIAALLQKETR